MDMLPVHIAFIMDGNGRWATSRGLERKDGHKRGVKVMKTIVEACKKKGVKYVSVFAFSTENWGRSKEEIDSLFDLMRNYFSRITEELGESIRLNIMGDVSRFPEDIRKLIAKIGENAPKTADFTFNIGINYGARQELLMAVNSITSNGIKNVDENIFGRFLYTADIPSPDMLIRTGGEKRLSNFMLYQLAYTELFFTDTLWPDFTVRELSKLVDEFSKRDRRFGAY